MFEGTHIRKPTGYVKMNDPFKDRFVADHVKNPTPL